jgi:hypothetical protein
VTDRTPFADLPAALVEEVLGQACAAGDLLLREFQRVRIERTTLREALQKASLIRHESELGYPPLPTTAATDGSYAIERLLTTDLAAAAAVAVEGLTPPSETRHWDQPRHSTFVAAEIHHEETSTVLRSVMLGRELILAGQAPHDLVMLDMTLTLPVIYLNQALNLAPNVPDLKSSQEFLLHASEYLAAYRDILWSRRSDRQYISLPKYSTRREIGKLAEWPMQHDDRGLLTLLLQPGEYTKPLDLEQPEQEWHININRIGGTGDNSLRGLVDEIVAGLKQVQIFYYKPHSWLPALRVEAAKDVLQNPHRLSIILQGLKYQCATASMLEPYPLYLADRTVKALARSLPAFRQVATQQISEKYQGNISEVFFAMHGYRSETGA